jgi:hypothetical protein
MGVAPSKAGTSKKPKACHALKLGISNDQASKTTASRIEISFPEDDSHQSPGLRHLF